MDKNFGTNDIDIASKIAVRGISNIEGDDQIYVLGETYDLNREEGFDKSDIFLKRFSSDGNQVWNKYLRFSEDFGDITSDYAINPQSLKAEALAVGYGSIYFAGSYDTGVFIEKCDDSGNTIWRKFIENADRVGQLLTGGNGSLYL